MIWAIACGLIVGGILAGIILRIFQRLDQLEWLLTVPLEERQAAYNEGKKAAAASAARHARGPGLHPPSQPLAETVHRFYNPPSPPSNTSRPIRHSAPVSLPLNQLRQNGHRPPADPWAYEGDD